MTDRKPIHRAPVKRPDLPGDNESPVSSYFRGTPFLRRLFKKGKDKNTGSSRYFRFSPLLRKLFDKL